MRAVEAFYLVLKSAQAIFVRQFALPNRDNVPASSAQRYSYLIVSELVALDLTLPPIRACRSSTKIPTLMTVPKTTMNEDGDSMFRQDEIKATGLTLIIYPEAETESMLSLTGSGECVQSEG
jgi:hypothetical protein